MDASTIISKLGGTEETAKLCGISPSAVSQWKRNGIPRPWMKFFRAERPDIFEKPPAKHNRRSTDNQQ